MSDRTPKPCLHPNSRHEHGTRLAYVRDLCRCEACTKANREYEDRRRRKALYGRTDLVDATQAREHIRALMAAGIGHKRIALMAGVSRGVVAGVLYGNPVTGRPPSRRIRPAAAAALLALAADTPDPRAVMSTWRPKRLALPAPDPRRPPLKWEGVQLDDLDPGMGWQSAALCAQVDPELWFPERGGSVTEARATCARCPVRQPCLDLGLSTGSPYGVYGGLAHQQRRKDPGYRPATDWVKERRVRIVTARHDSGWSDVEIAAELGLSSESVQRIRREQHIGITYRKASA